jgi:hypothetical protein
MASSQIIDINDPGANADALATALLAAMKLDDTAPLAESFARVLGINADGDPARKVGDPLMRADLIDAPTVTAGISAAVGIDAASGIVLVPSYVLIATWNGVQKDTGTPQNAALQALIAKAEAQGYTHIHFPKGTYTFDNLSTILFGNTHVKMTGDGIGSTIFKWHDNVSLTRQDFFRMSVDDVIYFNLTLEDIEFRGDWGDDGDYTSRSYMFSLDTIGEVRANRCKFAQSRSMGFVATGAASFEVTNCVFQNIYADGARAIGCGYVNISRNAFNCVCDDSIAVHSLDTQAAPLQTQVIVADNIIIDSQGICVLSGKRVSIHHNILVRTHVRAIQVLAVAGPEGASAGLSISIDSNHIDTVFNGNTLQGAGGGGVAYIKVETPPLTQVGGQYPMGPDGSGGIVKPAPYYFSNNIDDTPPAIGTHWINITNNICTRTLEPVAHYTDYGLPTRIGRNGPVTTVAVTAATLGCDEVATRGHIWIVNAAHDMLIRGNQSYGSSMAVFFQHAAVTTEVAWRNVVVNDNLFENFAKAGVYVEGSGFINVKGNLFSGDPLHTHSRRLPNGKWGFVTAIEHAAIWNSAGCFMELRDNTMEHVQGYSGGVASNIHSNDNVARCKPAVAGYDANNIGIGQIGIPGQGGAENFIMVDHDPASATYGNFLNKVRMESTAMPSTGYYFKDWFVRKTYGTIETGGDIELGWLRLTTGTGHVAGTDWQTIHAVAVDRLTGSAVYDPPSLVDGAGATTTVTVTGAALGDYVEGVSFSLDVQGITLTGWVSAANTVSVRFQNETGGTLDLASGTVRAAVKQK